MCVSLWVNACVPVVQYDIVCRCVCGMCLSIWRGWWLSDCVSYYKVEPPIVDPPRKEHCMLDLSIKDIAQGPKNYPLYSSNT